MDEKKKEKKAKLKVILPICDSSRLNIYQEWSFLIILTNI